MLDLTKWQMQPIFYPENPAYRVWWLIAEPAKDII